MRRKKLKEDSFVQGVQHYTVKIWGCSCDSSAGSFITGNRGITVRNACPKYAKQMECITRSPARCVKEKHSRISTLLYGLTKTLSTGHVRISTQWGQLCWRNWTSTWCWISRWIKCITAVMDCWESFSFIGSAEKAMHRTTHDDVAKFSCRLVRFQGSILPSSPGVLVTYMIYHGGKPRNSFSFLYKLAHQFWKVLFWVSYMKHLHILHISANKETHFEKSTPMGMEIVRSFSFFSPNLWELHTLWKLLNSDMESFFAIYVFTVMWLLMLVTTKFHNLFFYI